MIEPRGKPGGGRSPAAVAATHGVPTNADVAGTLEQVADLLQMQDASVFRVRAYHRAADEVRSLDRPVAELLDEGGRAALEALPGIGRGLASTIAEYVHTGRLGMLERLLGQVAPEDLFTTVPGIGERLAHRIHDELGIETLEELEQAAHDGRLDAMEGFGPRRVQGVRAVLAGRLSRSMRRARRADGLRSLAAGDGAPPRPPIAELLAVDGQYRRNAEAGRLRRIAPRRFNPTGEAWLPVLHTERGDWSYQALFSNTAQAHRLGRTHEWVVIYFERDGHEDQVTVVTESQGPLRGRRVVRGREDECRAHYGIS